MKNTAQKMILISFVLALIATATVFIYLKSLNTEKEEPIKKTTTIIVAAETIPPRTLIEQKMIKEIQVSDDTIFTDYIKESTKIIGKYTKETIFANEGFNINKVQDKNLNELSLKIPSNYRAVSISVTGDSGVSSLLKPGDYVDVVSYIAEKKDDKNVVRPDTAKIILQKVEVLAVDKQINREVKENTAAENGQTVTNFLVTLSIPISEVEKLVLAESLGSLKLALRAFKDESITKTEGTTSQKIYINSVEDEKAAASDPKVTTSSPKETVSKPKSSSTTTSGTTSQKKYISYTVKRGDTLREISSKYYGDKSKYTLIMGANNIKDENHIEPGDVIRIPILK